MDRKNFRFSRVVGFCALAVVAVLALSVSTLQAEVGDQIIKFDAPDAAYADHLGSTIDIDGTMAIVGTQDKNVTAGSAYVFNPFTGGLLNILAPSEGAGRGDRFGCSVAIDGDIAVVGSRGTEHDTGSAYVFDLTNGQQLCEFTANDGDWNDRFGYSVGIDGNNVIVGAWSTTNNTGSTYLFDLETGSQRALSAGEGIRIGQSVSISGNTAVVGGEESAYLFDVTSGNMITQLTSNDHQGGDQFGFSVDIHENTAIVGAYGKTNLGFSYAGAAYLFNATSGAQIAKITPDDPAFGDSFGWDVGICGNTAIVSATGDDDNGNNSGSAYLFNTQTEIQLAKLMADDGAEYDSFGSSVAITSLVAAVGALSDCTTADYAGSAYTFEAPEIQEDEDIPPLDVTRLSQGDPQWKDKKYDGLDKTIQKKGCAVTSLAMALKYAGIDIDPGDLNTLMQTKGGYSGSSVHWSDATRIAANNAEQPDIHFHDVRSSNTNDLDNMLSEGHPVIVRVPNGQYYDSEAKKWKTKYHFVVVTGKENGQYTIADPGYSDRTTLGDYGNLFETRGYVEDPLDVSELDIAVSSDLLAEGAGEGIIIFVMDPSGKTTYYNASGQIQENIPNSVLYVDYMTDIDSDDPPENISQMVSIFHPELGEYYVNLYCPDGTGTPFELTIAAYAADGSEMWRDVYTGNLASSGWSDYTFNYTPEPTTLSLLCLTALMVCKRRRRQVA